jgi:hypothetical protein
VTNIDLDKVPVPYETSVIGAADFDKNEEDDCDEEEERGEESPYLSRPGRPFYLVL